jgi:hypothetical protein
VTPLSLGIFAAANTTVPTVPNSFESISTAAITTTTSTVTFSSIPSTYDHLQIRILGRTSLGGAPDNVYMRFNSDSGTNYTNHYLWGNGTNATSSGGGSADTFVSGRQPGTDSLANTYGASIIDVLDYGNTNKFKTIRVFTGWDVNGSGEAFYSSGVWRNSNAVSTITLTNSFSWLPNSHLALYGIKVTA